MANKEKEGKEKSHFFKNFKAELKKVIWPTPKQVVNNTVAVIVVVLITAAIVFVLDLAFDGLNTFGINKIKGIVSSENITMENTTNANSVETENATDENTVEDSNTEVQNEVEENHEGHNHE